MAIYVHNGTASTMYVALAYHSPNCDGDNWAKMAMSVPLADAARIRDGVGLLSRCRDG